MRRRTTFSAHFSALAALTRRWAGVAMALLLLPAVAGASAIFEFEGHTYRIVTDAADWETAS